MQIFVRTLRAATLAVDVGPCDTVECLKGKIEEREAIPHGEQVLLHGGRLLHDRSTLAAQQVLQEATLDLVLRLSGGKGGFGSLLRGAGRAAMTDNDDACRDLSGRRMRYVNAEKKLKEWAAGEKERQRTKQLAREEREREKAERRAVRAVVDIDDVKEEQRAALASVAKAMQYGVAGRKRSSPEKAAARPVKRARYDSDGGSTDSESDSDEDELPVMAGSEESDPETGHSSGTDQEVGAVDADLSPAPVAPEGQELNVEAVIVSSPTTSADVAAPVPETAAGAEPLNIQSFASAAELESLGLEVLKTELQRHGLKCGGTLADRASRLFLLTHTPVESIDAKHKAKSASK